MNRRARGLAVTVLFASLWPAAARAEPFLPADIVVGASITGTFSYDTALLLTSGSGQYQMEGLGNFMSLTVGGVTFTTSLSNPNTLVRVTDSPSGQFGNPDFIQISSVGDEDSFGPYLTGFSRQNPVTDPRGELLLNFHFPNTYLTSNELPAVFDPLQTIGPEVGATFPNIYGQVEGVSTQTPTAGTREWAFFFESDPSSVTVSRSGTITSGTFAGRIVGVDDRAVTTPAPEPTPVPEPTSLTLLAVGVGVDFMRRLTRGNRRDLSKLPREP